jgi:para-aminobenzoate synthetase component 1
MASPGSAAGPPSLPFRGGWIGYLSYDLGRRLEPAARHRPARAAAADDRGWPLGVLGWCPDALVYDNVQRRWYAVGDAPPAELSGDADGDGGAFRAGALVSAVDPDAYLATVQAAIDYIAAGDIFQANITHRLSAPFEGSTRRLGRAAFELSGAWYGAYLELPGGRCLVSLSPELLLEVDAATRRVVTRPVKGTRPSAATRRELLDSAKDAAELNMIVDLMRNDLGRVCEYGSVRVPRARLIETHPTVHHGVAEVTGVLRPDAGVGRLLQAAFPGGSVTGAPKIRAMQVIDELEAVRRGPYCGAIGFVSACGRVELNVAIRTIALAGRRRAGTWGRLAGTLDYGVGGGIVADSTPLAEYRESMDKAEILRMVLASGEPVGVPGP